jgi:hypothetical protein
METGTNAGYRWSMQTSAAIVVPPALFGQALHLTGPTRRSSVLRPGKADSIPRPWDFDKGKLDEKLESCFKTSNRSHFRHFVQPTIFF